MFASRHGERLGRELGIDLRQVEIDIAGVKAGFGVDADVERLTYRDLQARRGADPAAACSEPGRASRPDAPVVARCTVDYAGRLAAHLPAAVRLIMVKADGASPSTPTAARTSRSTG